jgi:transposase
MQKATFMEIEPYLQALADCGRGLVAMPREAALTSATLETMYMQRMRQLGLADARGRVAWPELNQCVAGVVERLQEVPALAALGRRSTQGQILISRAVGSSRGAAHPLNHFTLVLSLYHQWEHFVAAYAAPIEARIPEVVCSTNLEVERRMSDKKQAVVRAVSDGTSVLAAARQSNVAVATAMAWVAATGLAIQRRPKKLTAKLRAVAIRLLKSGAEKRAVADSIKMSVQTVTLLLRTEVALHVAWTKARFSKAQQHARHTWKHSAEAFSRPTPRLLRSLQPAAYAWLYRNDRAWLQSYGTQLERAPRSNNSKLNWDARDRALAQSIREAALAVFETEARPRIRLSTLCNAVPTLKARLSSLRKLPLTQREIAIFLNRRIDPV